jgi:hypothetical protein
MATSSTSTSTSLPARPPSPWTGSRYAARYQWHLDGVRSLDEVVRVLRDIAEELDAAHLAGWWLTEPVRNGHLLAERASRRRRTRQPPPVTAGTAPPVLPPWRARVVEEAPQPCDAVLRLDGAASTPVVVVVDGALQQLTGPALPDRARRDLARQDVTGLDGRRWGVAPARVGPAADLVADGSALRVHAVEDGALVRTLEPLTFLHAADRAETLPSAAAAYRRVACAAQAMKAAGGWLSCVDDGFVQVRYGRP